MSLIRVQDAQLAFGADAILDHAEFILEAGERVCLVGRNGAGKSTLLKVIDQEINLDDGQVQYVGDTVVTRLPQDPPAQLEMSVYDYVAQALADVGEKLNEFNRLSSLIADDPSDEMMRALDNLQTQIDANNGWQFATRIEQVLTRLSLPADVSMSQLSGGWLRRVALARALVVDPDVLLLDEPTNHLDVDMVQWLEEQLLQFNGAILFISHDRAFIRKLATRIVDLDRGHLTSFPGNYDSYIAKKQELLEIEQSQNAEFDKKLAAEETWIRQGIKARRTRNEGRVRALQQLRKERAQRRELQGNAKMQVNQAQRSGKRVFEGEHVSLSFDKPIIRDLDLLLQRGDKIALVGPNGCGKSTLIKVILGEQSVDAGNIKLGTNLEVAYFDQHRSQLDPEKSVMDNVGDGKQDIVFQGRPRHILSYLQDFLFSPKQSRTPVRALSGGERNRALLAKILLKPSNILVLDEPTNDLDIETLELLEQIIADYEGTVLLVSHDREFVDNTATSVLLFEGEGHITEIFGGFSEIEHYLARKSSPEYGTKSASKESEKPSTQQSNNKGSVTKQKKLSYKLQRELEELPAQIEKLEAEIETLQQQMNEPEFFSQPIDVTQPVMEQAGALEEQLMSYLERWEELENLSKQSS
ncbi:ATP-binding cassette subfamily F protein uup [Idiomarina fontislapidosi]|uniref:ATP-binding protein Uup n=1 Tax=Idiomarina fontislapidosi TaxID=263723 RepID=A0A432Y9P6_9GAMM|nr:ABC transporter ATP-binding protein [Idiomarina fontislapidosi]PYE34338.1 ATP-binding cassette subfamily F protein uup [Idiomarina fontislapidosi]RUO57700.1 ABC transporter ATP-binding protein [Idiomarina fontislapidosi]|tara:strand:+ start:2396 stop:4318 length:1923 start_codon:yes stop_codon:yes gene_type:complete